MGPVVFVIGVNGGSGVYALSASVPGPVVLVCGTKSGISTPGGDEGSDVLSGGGGGEIGVGGVTAGGVGGGVTGGISAGAGPVVSKEIGGGGLAGEGGGGPQTGPEEPVPDENGGISPSSSSSGSGNSGGKTGTSLICIGNISSFGKAGVSFEGSGTHALVCVGVSGVS